MNLSLSDKVFLISGGASGIGAAISKSLLLESARPVILDKAPFQNCDPELHTAVEDGRADYHEVDLCEPDAVKKAIGDIVTSTGRIDGVINNAGVNDSVGLDKSSADFEASLQRNLVQCFSLVHHALSELKKTKGTILNIGSKVYTTGQGGTSGYAAAKGGLASLTREWALDLAPFSIRCNAVIPAEVWTQMYADWLGSREDSEEAKKAIESRIPLEQRFTTPEEIADMSVFLLSEKSSHTTGQIIHVDGGYTHLDRAFCG